MHVMFCFFLVLINYSIYFSLVLVEFLNLLFGFANLDIYL